MLLQAQNFSPATVNDNLSICILSYASLRIDSNKKDIRNVYKENGALENLSQYLNAEDFTLINIIRKMNPLVIVEINPTALKAEHMVKLPVIVYHSHDKKNLIDSVIGLRNNLEKAAVAEEKISGRYIRPIVLFQAQPDAQENSDTFDKIKIAKSNELRNTDLMSRDCAIRFIITINALKEGWDCPFAYILASLANKNSQIDVEQIVGRILRQPYTTNNTDKILNASYIFSCSEDFQHTVESSTIIIAGKELAAKL